jgi:hypothetical protein
VFGNEKYYDIPGTEYTYLVVGPVTHHHNVSTQYFISVDMSVPNSHVSEIYCGALTITIVRNTILMLGKWLQCYSVLYPFHPPMLSGIRVVSSLWKMRERKIGYLRALRFVWRCAILDSWMPIVAR